MLKRITKSQVRELIWVLIDAPFDATSIERPDPSLFRYYVFVSLMSGPIAPLVLLPLYFRYITLRYKFDDSGVSMSWGILFRKEVYLTYRRIQDIHLTRNLLQRLDGIGEDQSADALPEVAKLKWPSKGSCSLNNFATTCMVRCVGQE